MRGKIAPHQIMLVHSSPSRSHLLVVIHKYLISPYPRRSQTFTFPHPIIPHRHGPLMEFHIIFRRGGMWRSDTDTGALLAGTTGAKLPSATGAQPRCDLGYEMAEELGEGREAACDDAA